MTPVIAVSAYTVDGVRNWAEGAHALPSQYSRAVLRAGGTPVLVPPGVADAATLLDRIDGLVLAGGGDVSPARYGADEVPEIEFADPERDDTEFALVDAAWERSLPTLAICRGMQVANVALGGSLHGHLEGDPHRNAAERLPVEHAVTVAAGSRLATVLGTRHIAVPSLHHQAVDRIAAPLQPVAWSPDGVVEGLEAPDRWFVAVQWHPEIAAANDPVQGRLFAALVAAAG